jgi:hypothetical protein
MIIIENIAVSQYQNINKNISNTQHSFYEGEGWDEGCLLLKGWALNDKVICWANIVEFLD